LFEQRGAGEQGNEVVGVEREGGIERAHAGGDIVQVAGGERAGEVQVDGGGGELLGLGEQTERLVGVGALELGRGLLQEGGGLTRIGVGHHTGGARVVRGGGRARPRPSPRAGGGRTGISGRCG
jgi:hypothetical protein